MSLLKIALESDWIVCFSSFILSFLLSRVAYSRGFRTKVNGKLLGPQGGAHAASDLHAFVVVGLWSLWMYRNASYSALFGESGLLYNAPLMIASQGVPDRFIVVGTVAFSVAYFLSDLLLILTVKDLFDPVFIFHHVVIGGGLAFGLLLGAHTTVYHFLFIIEESSTILMNARWRALQTKAASSRIALFGLLFALTYFAVRIVWGTILFATVFPDWINLTAGQRVAVAGSEFLAKHMWVQFSACVLSRGLNFYWFALILKALVRGKKTAAKKMN